ncbi:MAG: DUF3108 domain-containing protein [Alphaproteobacteria bacterium]|nr:DUF3108 domain-containing protein [Alphaproteobacteria bacterium]
MGTRIITAVGFAATVSAALLGGPGSAVATQDQRFAAEFEVYWLGLHVFSGQLQGEIADDRYRMASFTETRGVLDLFVTAHVRSEALGRVEDQRLVPVTYQTRSEWNSRKRELDMAFREDGTVEAERRPPPEPEDFDADRDEVPQALRREARDPLTTLLSATTVSLDAAPCDRSLPVFDGRRRYNLRLEYVRDDRLAPDTVPAYSGPAVVCHAHFERIAGFAKKWNEENPQPEEPAVVWLARMPDAGVWLPVRAEGQSSWGSITAALIRHDFGKDASTTSGWPEP